jgi:hypothetical protein
MQKVQYYELLLLLSIGSLNLSSDIYVCRKGAGMYGHTSIQANSATQKVQRKAHWKLLIRETSGNEEYNSSHVHVTRRQSLAHVNCLALQS